MTGNKKMCKLLVAIFLAASFVFISPTFWQSNAYAFGAYTVTYDGNGNTGGSIPTDGSTYEFGDYFFVQPIGDLVKTGHTFNYWSEQSTPGGSVYSDANMSTIPIGGDLTLYAIWAADGPTTYSVTYDGNGNTGGSVPTDTNAYIDTMSVTVLGNTGSLVRTDYTFAGWNTLANGLGTGYDQGILSVWGLPM